jgi:hypothetical protein
MTDPDNPMAVMCHYTRAETAFAAILPTGKLLMNPYSKMRDPYENQRPFFRSLSGGGDDRETKERLYWALQHQVSLSREKYSLLALTQGDARPGNIIEKPFRYPWSRARMWEQYAENHAGACLVFDREELLDAVRQNLERHGSFWEGPVNYTVGGFAASEAGTVTFDQFREGALEDDVRRHVQAHYEDFFFLKTQDWESEFEYRFVFERAVEGGKYIPRFNYVSYDKALRSIIVGEKFPDWQLAGAAEVARSAEVELLRMEWEANRPLAARPMKKKLNLPWARKPP